MFDAEFQAQHSDMIVPFQLEQSSLRGRFVRLGSTLDEILGKHQYPAPVARLVAEACTLACVLGSMLKEDGIFSLQAKGDGPVSLLVADYTADGALRAYASFNSEKLSTVPDRFCELLGDGYLAFTIDRGAGFERYQGIVQIEGDSLTTSAQHYFLQSEQVHTEIKFFCAEQGPPWHTGAICVQAMPKEGDLTEHDLDRIPDGWDEMTALIHTLTAAEAINPSLHPHDLLFRLFHEGGIRVYDTVHVQHRCRCGLERAQQALATLSEAEAAEFSENNYVEVKCEFCNSAYRFTLEELAELREQSKVQ